MFGSLVPPSEVDSAKGAFNCPQKLRNMEREVARMNRAKGNRIIDRGCFFATLSNLQHLARMSRPQDASQVSDVIVSVIACTIISVHPAHGISEL